MAFGTRDEPIVVSAKKLTGMDTFPAFLPYTPEGTQDDPDLFVSGDHTVGLAGGQGREFYATADVVANANATLKLIGSKVTLVADKSVRLTMDSSGIELYKVKPKFSADPNSVCRDFAQQIMGGYHTHIVLRERGRRRRSSTTPRIKTSDAVEVSGLSHLAQAMVEAVSGRSRPLNVVKAGDGGHQAGLASARPQVRRTARHRVEPASPSRP